MVETARKAAPELSGKDGRSTCFDGQMRSISAFWILVPTCIMGVSEILCTPAMYHFAYASAPQRTRSVTQAFNLLSTGSISGAFTSVLSRMLMPDDLDKGSIVPFYTWNIVFAIIGALLYLLMTSKGPSMVRTVAPTARTEELTGI